MENHEQIYRTKKQIFFNNFLGGIAWGLGATIGVSIFFAIIAFILSRINLIPVFGNFVTGIIEYVLKNNSSLLIK